VLCTIYYDSVMGSNYSLVPRCRYSSGSLRMLCNSKPVTRGNIIVDIVFNLRANLRILLLLGPAAAAHLHHRVTWCAQTPPDAPVTPRLTPQEASRCSGRHLSHRSSTRHHDSEGLRVDVRQQEEEDDTL